MSAPSALAGVPRVASARRIARRKVRVAMDEFDTAMLFNDEQIKTRMAEGRCLICGVQKTADTPKCTLQPLDIPPGTSLEAPHLWPTGEVA